MAILCCVLLGGLACLGHAFEPERSFVPIKNVKTLGVDRIPAQRIRIGSVGDYKPCIARLANGDLVVVAFQHHKRGGDKVYEPLIWFRSRDGGHTWSDAIELPLLGAEAYLSVLSDGTLFITTEFSEYDVRNQQGYTFSYLHRSTDNGQTWESTEIGWQDVRGAPPRAWTLTSRTVFELDSGAVIMTVSVPGGLVYLWRSTDRGKTWDKTLRCSFNDDDRVDKAMLPWPFMAETIFWQTRGGNLLALVRVDHRHFPDMAGRQRPELKTDQGGRLVVYRSRDRGQRWEREPELGSDYGEMYPSVLRLKDGRLLLTFTVRALRAPLGVQAVLGEELPDGFRFDFQQDRLILDAKTPLDKSSGGGFGPTVQLSDGTMVTVYSYRGPADSFLDTHLEILRWKLPPR